MVLAVKARFITGEDIQGSGVVGERMKGLRGALCGAGVVVIFQFDFKSSLLQGQYAELTPSSGGEGFHQVALNLRLRVHLKDQVVEELIE